MSVPAVNLEEFRRVGDEYSAQDAISVFTDRFPEKKRLIDGFVEEYGEEEAFKIILESLMPPAEAGMGDLRREEAGVPEDIIPTKPAVEARPAVTPTPVAKVPEPEVLPSQAAAEMQESIRQVTLTPFQRQMITLQKFRAAEERGEVPPPPDLNRILKRRLQQFTSEFPVYFRSGMVNAWIDMLTTPEEARELIRNGEWKKVTDSAEAGFFPSFEEIGGDFYQEMNDRFQRIGGTKGEGAIKLLNNALLDVNSSRSRETLFAGELPDFHIISMDWAVRHPKAAVLPLMLTTQLEEIAKTTTHPEKWPALALIIAAHRLVLAPASREFMANLRLNNDFLIKPIGEAVRSAGRAFPKKAPLTVETIQKILRGDPSVSDDVLRAFKTMSNSQKAHIARMAKKGAPVEIITPRWGQTEPFVRLTSQRLPFSEATPELREFFPPVPFEPSVAQRAAGIPSAPISAAVADIEAFAIGADRVPGVPTNTVAALRQRGYTDPQIEEMFPVSHVPPAEIPSPAAQIPKVIEKPPVQAELPLRPTAITELGAAEPTPGDLLAAEITPLLADFSHERIRGMMFLRAAVTNTEVLSKIAVAIGKEDEMAFLVEKYLKTEILDEIERQVAKVPEPISEPATEAPPGLLPEPIVPEEVPAARPVVPRRKKVTVLKKGDARKIAVLPQKKEILATIDEAIKKAPSYDIDMPPVPMIEFRIDGGVKIYNPTKEKLKEFRSRVQGMPETMVRLDRARKPAVPKPIAAKKEVVGELIKGMPEGFFSDGTMIIKGTPPKSAKFGEQDILPETVLEMLAEPAEPADLQYYLALFDQDIGVSPVPIASLEGLERKQPPYVIFKSGDNYWAFNQYRFNVLRKRYPDATYEINTQRLMLKATQDGETVGLLMAMKPANMSLIPMDSPPGLPEALAAGLVEGVSLKPPITSGEVAPLVEDLDEAAVRGILSLRDAGTDEEILKEFATSLGKSEEASALVKKHSATEILDEIARQAVKERPAETPLEEWNRVEATRLNERIKEDDEAGFIRLPRIERGPEEPKIEDPELEAALTIGRARLKSVGGFRDWFNDRRQRLRDFAVAEFEPELMRAEEYQFRNDVRAGLMPIPSRARHKMEIAYANIWGTLNNKEKEMLLRIIGMRSFLEDANQGLPIPRDFDPVKIEQQLNKYALEADQLNPEIADAFGRYKEYARLVGEELVLRGQLELEVLKEFYLPMKRLEHYPDWAVNAPFTKRRVRQPFRPYTIKRRGSVKDIVLDEDAMMAHFATVEADNMMDDWAKSVLAKNDILPNMTKEQRIAHFGEKGQPKKLGKYEIDGKTYRGFQYVPGNVIYKAEVANPILVFSGAEDIFLAGSEEFERIFRLPPEEQYKEVMDYFKNVGPRGGDAFRKALVIGRYNRVYVLPESIFNKMSKVKDSNSVQPFMHDVLKMTRFWKRLTLSLVGAGLKFQMGNLAGDALNVYRSSPGAFKHVPTAGKILWNLRPENQHRLSPSELEALGVVERQDVLSSGFYVEFTRMDPRRMRKMLQIEGGFTSLAEIGKLPLTIPMTALNFYEKMSANREALLRVALVSYQLKRLQDGLPLKAPEYKHIIDKLDTESAIGFIARNVPVDYVAVSDKYRRYVSGFLFPFAPFWQKNAHNWALYTKNAPIAFTGKVIAPIAAAWTWNNTGWRRDIEERLGYFQQRTFHIVLRKYDDDNDGKADRAKIFGIQLPTDMAMQFMGIHLLPGKITMLRKSLENVTDEGERNRILKEAALEQLWDMGLATPKLMRTLVTPMIQVMDGLATNRDPFTRKAIVPSELSNIPDYQKMRYWTPYVIGKFITPFGQYMKDATDEELFGVVPTEVKDVPSALKRYLINGPLNPIRAMGIYDVNLNAAEAFQMMNIGRDARSVWAKAMYDIETAYKNVDMDGVEFLASDKVKRIKDDAKLNGITLENEKMLMRIGSPRVQIDKLQRLILEAEDDEEKRKLEKRYNAQLKIQAMESQLKVPDGAFDLMIKRLGQERPLRRRSE